MACTSSKWGKFWLWSSIWPWRSRSIIPQNNMALNQGLLHLWSTFGDPSLKSWWVNARTKSWLTDTQTHAGNDNIRRPKLASVNKMSNETCSTRWKKIIEFILLHPAFEKCHRENLFSFQPIQPGSLNPLFLLNCVWGNIKCIYICYHLWTLRWTRLWKSFLVEDKDLSCIVISQNHSCWWPGEAQIHSISSHELI